MKSALLERELAKTDTTALFGILDEAISRFADFDKLPLIAAQACLDDLKDVDRARKYVKAGLKECPRSVPLWLLSARAEEQAGGENKARSTLELARLKVGGKFASYFPLVFILSCLHIDCCFISIYFCLASLMFLIHSFFKIRNNVLYSNYFL